MESFQSSWDSGGVCNLCGVPWVMEPRRWSLWESPAGVSGCQRLWPAVSWTCATAWAPPGAPNLPIPIPKSTAGAPNPTPTLLSGCNAHKLRTLALLTLSPQLPPPRAPELHHTGHASQLDLCTSCSFRLIHDALLTTAPYLSSTSQACPSSLLHLSGELP